MDSWLSQGHWLKVKRKQLCPGFENESSIPFPTTITVTLSTPLDTRSGMKIDTTLKAKT